MKSYIQHLLEDIKKAHRPISPEENQEAHFTFEEEMEAIENYATGRDIPPSLGNQCGLAPDQFPPPDQLTEDEMNNIIEAFHDLLSSWNMQAELPSEMPVSRVYPLMVSLLNQEAWFFPTGTLHLDFCTGYAPGCELKEYCPCLKVWNSEEETQLES